MDSGCVEHVSARWVSRRNTTRVRIKKLTLGTGYSDKCRPICPQPPQYTWGSELVPVPPIPYFKEDVEDELNCLNLNVVLPHASRTKNLPVMV